MIQNLWGIVQFTSGPSTPENRWLSPALIKLGWTRYFEPIIDIVRNTRPYGLILHLCRGITAEKDQQFFANDGLELTPATQHLFDDWNAYNHAVRQLQRYTRVVSYEGPPPGSFAMWPASARRAAVRAELKHFQSEDGIIIDGAGGTQEGDRWDCLLKELNSNRNWNIPPGVESMAVKGAADHVRARPSLTLAGVGTQYDPERSSLGSGAESVFAPPASITGERIVLDAAKLFLPNGSWDYARWDRRAKLILSDGNSLCIPHTLLPTVPYCQGIVTAPPVNPAPPVVTKPVNLPTAPTPATA